MDDIRIGSHSRVIQFLTKDGIKLKGILFSGAKRPRTCIIYVHGMSGSALSSIPLAFSSRLGRDFAIFSFNNRGYGLVSGFSKYTDGRRTSVRIGTNLEKFEDCIHDIKGAIDILAKLGYGNFVLCGHSTGCQKAAYYQYKMRDRRIRAIVLIAPCDDYNLNVQRLGKNLDFVMKACMTMIRSHQEDDIAPDQSGYSAQRLDSVIDLSRVEARLFDYDGPLKEFATLTTPMLAIFGKKEENTIKPVGECLDILAKKTSSKRFGKLLIPDAMHSFEGKEEELVRKVENWIRRLN